MLLSTEEVHYKYQGLEFIEFSPSHPPAAQTPETNKEITEPTPMQLEIRPDGTISINITKTPDKTKSHFKRKTEPLLCYSQNSHSDALVIEVEIKQKGDL